MTNYFEILEITGYCVLTVETTSDLIQLSEKLGKMLPSKKNSSTKIDTLTISSNRTDKSLSAKYKDKQFPFHTDGASLPVPPRYIILRNETEGNDCPTLLCHINLTKEDIPVLKRDVWLVNGGRGRFYSSVFSEMEGSSLLRFDQDCMRPTLSPNKSVILIQEIIEKSEIIEIHWKKNLTVIFDNWKLLHARGDATDSPNRILQRIWIN